MKRNLVYYIVIPCCAVFVCIAFLLVKKGTIHSDKELAIVYPFRGMLFPPEFPAPTFYWYDVNPSSGSWKIEITMKDCEYKIDIITHEPKWKPDPEQWDSIKSLSNHQIVFMNVSRVKTGKDLKHAKSKSYFSISTDEVGAPILYREIPLPFAFAEMHPEKMSYRLINIASDKPPHYAMEKFLVCGNCHSFSAEGRTIGLDLDAAKRDKGGYFIEEIKDTMIFDTSNYMSWSKLQGSNTFGIFSKVSPGGRYVVTTIKDRVVSKSYGFDLDALSFSQFFLPVNGVLAIFDRETGKLAELPGANSNEYVQTNAFWTPDGKNIVFCRAKSLFYSENIEEINVSDENIVEEFANRQRKFIFDICMIPFNDGKGGTAKPIKGASENGMSNYFPAVSPDGKWMVFCKAENYMLLMPDSKLYIVPLTGGRARKLKCNFPLMNSWHAWSPNGKWLVFSSKGLSAFTDLFLTHIDDKGNASIPVLLEHARGSGKAANYPEFLNINPGKKITMIYNYVNIDHISLARTARDTALALFYYDQFIKQGQYSLVDEFMYLAKFNYEMNRYNEAIDIINQALRKYPGNRDFLMLSDLVKARM